MLGQSLKRPDLAVAAICDPDRQRSRSAPAVLPLSGKFTLEPEEIYHFMQWTAKAFLISLPFVPVLATFLGALGRPKVLLALVGGQVVLMATDLGLMSHLLETQRYPRATGMEVIGLCVMPALLLVSIAVSFVAYLVGRRRASRR